MSSYRVKARVFPPEGRFLIIRGSATGWRPSNVLESGVRLHFVSALLPIGNRGVRIPEGESLMFELCISHVDVELSVGTQWSIDYSGGAYARVEVAEILEKAAHPDWLSEPRASLEGYGFVNIS